MTINYKCDDIYYSFFFYKNLKKIVILLTIKNTYFNLK